ncbi:MAG: hypothetical protein CO093_07715 [Alphaproteobacteria bacterium CG_4_9_14_3_um_filter_47_13]|nr:MAG: hypothetical protein CO093_07715 [Alphaproteobacteria bacterium CG_4_9_14_3_um_filter_47_13]
MLKKEILKTGLNSIPLISSGYAYATIPQLTGLKGVFGAAMTGVGTSFISALYSMGGGVLGAIFGGAVAKAINKDVKSGAALGGLICALGSTVYGIPHGYDLAKDVVLNGILPRTEISETAPDTITNNHQNDIQARLQKQFPMLHIPKHG